MKIRAAAQRIREMHRYEAFVPHNVRLPVEIKIQGRGGRGNRQQVREFILSVGVVPVLGIAPQPDAVVDPPELQRVGPAGLEWLGANPLVTVPLDHIRRHHGQRRKRAQAEKKSGGRNQFHAQRVVIQRAHAHGLCVRELAQMEFLGVLEIEEQGRIVGRRGRLEHPQPRPHKFPGGDRFAGGPRQVRAQMKGVNQPIGRKLPVTGQRGFRVACPRVETGQPLKQRGHHAHLRLAGDDLRVERFRFCAVDDDEVGRFLPRAAAAGAEQRTDEATGK